MTLQGKVICLMPMLKPSRAVIKVRDWDESLSVPMGNLAVGQHVEIRIDSLLVSGAAVGRPVS